MINLVLNKSPQLERKATFVNKGEENFSAKDKLANFIERKMETTLEVEELA